MWWWRLWNAGEDRAVLIIRQGVFYDLELMRRRVITKDGDIYTYGKHMVLVPVDFPFEVYERERFLGMVDGELVTTPFVGTGIAMDESLISSFMGGNAVTQLSDSMEYPPHGGMNFKQLRWVLLVVALIVVGFVVWKFVLHGQIPGTTPTVTPTPTPTPQPTPGFTWSSDLTGWVMWLRGAIGV
jgi:hypothetical protein